MWEHFFFIINNKDRNQTPLLKSYRIFHHSNKEKSAKSTSSAMEHEAVDIFYGHSQSSKQFFAFRVGPMMLLTDIFPVISVFLDCLNPSELLPVFCCMYS